MLHLLLTILKILGIVLLVILGILMAAILVVLFVPIRYRGDVRWADKRPKGGIRVSWLFRSLRIRVSFEGSDVRLQGRFLWFCFFDTAKKQTEEAEDMEEHIDHVEKRAEDKTDTREIRHEATAESAEPSPSKQTFETEHLSKNKNRADRSDKKKQSLYKKLRKKISTWIERIQSSYRRITGDHEEMKRKIRRIQALWENEENQKTVRLLWRQIRKLIKHILPGNMSGRVRFGFDDPATTGQILTYISPFYGIYAEQILIEPVFDESVFEGELHLKGYIRAGTVLWMVLRVCLNKNFRLLLKRIMKSRR